MKYREKLGYIVSGGIVSFALIISSCAEKDKIVGSWIRSDVMGISIVFDNDGQYVRRNLNHIQNGTYHLEGNRLHMTQETKGKPDKTKTCVVSVIEDVLILEYPSGGKVAYERSLP